jgi:hypothetical protein
MKKRPKEKITKLYEETKLPFWDCDSNVWFKSRLLQNNSQEDFVDNKIIKLVDVTGVGCSANST